MKCFLQSRTVRIQGLPLICLIGHATEDAFAKNECLLSLPSQTSWSAAMLKLLSAVDTCLQESFSHLSRVEESVFR